MVDPVSEEKFILFSVSVLDHIISLFVPNVSTLLVETREMGVDIGYSDLTFYLIADILGSPIDTEFFIEKTCMSTLFSL